MKRGFTIGLFALSLFFALCSPDKEKKSAPDTSVQKADTAISIRLAGSLEFNRSYSFIQSPSMSEKEKDRLLKEVSESNPLLSRSPGNDSIFRKRFEELGIVKGKELLLNNFRDSDKPDSTLTTATGKEIRVHFKKDTVRGTDNRIVVVGDNATAETNAAIYYNLKYALLDIIPGGNKEIVILNYHYLSNNELYYLDVYEIKTKD